MTLPTEKQIAAAVSAVARMHGHYYRRPIKDGYAQAIVWAAVCAIILNEAEASDR